MFKPKDTGHSENVDTIIGAGTVFEGNIESQGSIRVDGKVKGDIRADGDILIGSGAVVIGNICACSISISGTVEGNVHSSDILRITSTARLYGDIEVNSFVADEGGIFQGRCSMLNSQEAPLAAENTSDKKPQSGKRNKKSSVIEQIYEDRQNTDEAI